ncbi:acyltransferase [Candidatus Saccharibacteria bacterium]|nr:acyltransferase [Candidatus Saccharibacteria bacterium]
MIKKLLGKLIYKETYSEDTFVNFLNKNGVSVGKNTCFFDPRTTFIDVNRGNYIKIGANCKITSGVRIVAHDYSWSNLIDSNKVIYPSGGKHVEIGDNVFIGVNTTIIGPVKIGNNVIIGAGSLVCKDLPDNTVCAGNPARVIKSMDEYVKKAKETMLENLYDDVDVFIAKNHRFPSMTECGGGRYAVLFMDKTEENWQWYASTVSLKGVNLESARGAFMSTEKVFESYDEFRNGYEKSRKERGK